MSESSKSIFINENIFDCDYCLKQVETMDRLIPEFLVLQLQEGNQQHHEFDIILNKMKMISLKIMVENIVLEHLPLLFLCSFQSPIQRGTKIYIKLPMEYLTKNITICNLVHQTIYYYIDGWCELINHVFSYSLITKNYLDTELERRNSFNGERIQNIQQVRCLYFFNEGQNNQYSIPLFYSFGNNKYNGFFIQCCIEDLREVKITKNGMPILHYNDFLIDYYTKKISATLLYFSFNVDDLESYKKSSGHYTLSITDSSSIILSLIFSRPQNKVGIYGFTKNYLIYCAGMVHLQHSYNDTIFTMSN
jgi:hypothetical protein